MRSSHSLDRLDTAFDVDCQVADGFPLPAAQADHLGLKELVDRHLDLRDRPAGRTPATSSTRSSGRRSRAATASTPERSGPAAPSGSSSPGSIRYPGVWVQGLGEYGENGATQTVAITIGPEFGA